jgi:hypothetical protein
MPEQIRILDGDLAQSGELAKSRTNDQSSAATSAPPGTRNTCWTLSARCGQSRVNLDSLP